jgi:hypothetical protein
MNSSRTTGETEMTFIFPEDTGPTFHEDEANSPTSSPESKQEVSAVSLFKVPFKTPDMRKTKDLSLDDANLLVDHMNKNYPVTNSQGIVCKNWHIVRKDQFEKADVNKDPSKYHVCFNAESQLIDATAMFHLQMSLGDNLIEKENGFHFVTESFIDKLNIGSRCVIL